MIIVMIIIIITIIIIIIINMYPSFFAIMCFLLIGNVPLCGFKCKCKGAIKGNLDLSLAQLKQSD